MKRDVRTIIAPLMFLSMAITGIILLCIGLFTGASFNAFFAMSAIISGAVLFGDRLRVFDLKNLRIELAKIKEVRSEIYAKADEVRSMMVDLADTFIASALESGRLTDSGLALQREMLSKRERARALLSRTGISDSEITRRLDPITEQVAEDLLHELDRHVKKAFASQTHPDKPCFGLYEGLDPSLWNRIAGKDPPKILDGINAYIIEKGLNPDNFKHRIDVLKHFMEHDSLPDGDMVEEQV